MSSSSRIEESGTKFDGILEVNGIDKFGVATDLHTLSSYYPQGRGLTKKKVQAKLEKERKKFQTQ